MDNQDEILSDSQLQYILQSLGVNEDFLNILQGLFNF